MHRYALSIMLFICGLGIIVVGSQAWLPTEVVTAKPALQVSPRPPLTAAPVAPTSVPATSVPPTSAPATSVPPTAVVPTSLPQTSAPATSVPAPTQPRSSSKRCVAGGSGKATPTPLGRITGTVIDLSTGYPAKEIEVRVGQMIVGSDWNANYTREGLGKGSYVVQLLLQPGQGVPAQAAQEIPLEEAETKIVHLFFYSQLSPTPTQTPTQTPFPTRTPTFTPTPSVLPPTATIFPAQLPETGKGLAKNPQLK